MEAERILQSVVQRAREIFGDKLRIVILFGSRARGEDDPFSDFDILVVAEELPVSWLQRDDITMQLAQFDGGDYQSFDFVLHTSAELETAFRTFNPLIMSIFEEFRVLWGEENVLPFVKQYDALMSDRQVEKLSRFTWKLND